VTLSGLTLIALGCASFVTVDQHPSVLSYALRVIPIGLGMGLFNAANNSSVLNAVAHRQLAQASALLSLVRTLGQTTGVPLIAAVFSVAALGHVATGRTQALITLPHDALLRGIHMAFAIATFFVALSIAAASIEIARRVVRAPRTGV